MIRLALLRHGHTAWNRAGQIQGRTDVPLEAQAAEDLGRLALPERWQGAALYSSTLGRARRTAEIVAGRAPVPVPELIEMSWGGWEGAKAADLIAAGPETSGYRHLEDWGWTFRPPGGESPAELRARVLPWIEGLREDAVLVTHIGVMRVCLAVAHGWDFAGPAPFAVKRNRLYLLELEGGVLRPADPAVERLEVRT